MCLSALKSYQAKQDMTKSLFVRKMKNLENPKAKLEYSYTCAYSNPKDYIKNMHRIGIHIQDLIEYYQ
jgi:hypothetical protein